MSAPSLHHVARHIRPQLKRQANTLRRFKSPSIARQHIPRTCFHSSCRLAVVRPYLLADIGEGITECQIIQWFVQPGARVAQFDKICEVQSDKAAVEITSRFDGVIKKLHYEADDMAQVGKPLVDIDIQGEISPEDEALTKTEEEKSKEEERQRGTKEATSAEPSQEAQGERSETVEMGRRASVSFPPPSSTPSGKHKSLATPAVRHMVKEQGLSLEDIPGTGKDGRVLKEDVQKFVSASAATEQPPTVRAAVPSEPLGEDTPITFSPVQRKMFEAMTNSLSIPHFLYTDNVDFTSLSRVRRALNSHAPSAGETAATKLSSLPFILKAVSLALTQFPCINAHLETSGEKPAFTHKAAHNIGVAMDTPQGLIVPVIKNVQAHSIYSLAAEIQRLSQLARSNKLGAADLTGATFTVSNIGSLGGTAVAPVIVSPQVAILGVGRARAVPAFGEKGEVIRKEEAVFSWSADHRVVDGATVARCAELVRSYLEGTERMLVRMR